MADIKDRTDIVAQAIAAEALTMALAKMAVAGMTDKQKQDFRASVTANLDEISSEVTAQAPAIGRGRGLSAQASNMRAANIVRDGRELTKAHLDTLLGAAS